VKVISTATTIGQAFKNAGRVTEILGVFVRHGFADLLQRMKLSRFLSGKDAENPRFQELPVEKRLRLSFEQLGPTFVKLGQLLATRPDLLPESFVEEFQKLQDNVSATPFPELKSFIETELRTSIDSVFSEFEMEPMAAASIAQVHGAVLKTGQQVAVKVQRPGIERIIQNDVSILRGLALLLEKYIPESRPFNPTGLVEEFFKTILWELDFRVEANNIRKIRSNLADLSRIAIPEVYAEASTARVLVLERFVGIRFSDRDAIIRAGINPSDIVEVGSDAFFHMVMRDGLFHGDLHPGNLFILPDGRIGIIDFGIVGRLSRRVQDSIISMFIALIDEDYETLAVEYGALCQGDTDINQLQKDLMDTISPYVGMSLGEVNVGQLLLRSTSIAVRHNLKVPREMMLLFKAMVTIEALGKKLDPGFDLMQVGTRLARQVLTTRYGKERLTHDIMVIGRDLQALAETTPRLLRRATRKWAQNEFAIETRSKDTRAIANAIRGFSYVVLVSTLAVGCFGVGIACLIYGLGPTFLGLPLWPVLALGAAVTILIRNAWRLRKRLK